MAAEGVEYNPLIPRGVEVRDRMARKPHWPVNKMLGCAFRAEPRRVHQ